MALYDYAGSTPVRFLAGDTIIANTFVKIGAAANTVLQATAATETIIGVALQAAVVGDYVPVQIAGIAKVITNGTCALGEVEVAADGEATTAGGATAYSVGVCLAAASADQDVVPVLLACPAVKRPPNS